MDKLSRDDMTAHLKELITENNSLDTVSNEAQINHQRGKVEGFRYLLSLVQSTK